MSVVFLIPEKKDSLLFVYLILFFFMFSLRTQKKNNINFSVFSDDPNFINQSLINYY